MYVCGIDAGLRNTGLVVLDMDYGVQSLNLIQAEPSAAKRLRDIELAVDLATNPYDVTVFIEGYAYGAAYQRESLAELGGVLRRFFYVESIPYWVIPPLMLKQFVTGSARAKKNYMKKCTKERWDMDFKSDDVCDAYGLARLGVGVLTGDTQDDIVAKILSNQGNYLEANTARRK